MPTTAVRSPTVPGGNDASRTPTHRHPPSTEPRRRTRRRRPRRRRARRLDARTAAEAAIGDVIWSQEFNGSAGSAPDGSVWSYDTGAGGWGNAELQNYTTSRNNSALDGQGNLVITARREGDGSYTSARLQSNNKVEVKYGRVEARIQIPRGQGIWPAFWMLGADFPQTSWPSSGEIDIMENVGKEPHRVYGTVHGPGYSGGSGITGAYQHPQSWSFADAFHTFAVDWKPGSITWSVDGNVYHQVTTASVGGNPWVFDKAYFLILNVAVGGQWPGYPDGTTQFPQQMKVDYVRVYDNGSGSGGGGGGGGSLPTGTGTIRVANRCASTCPGRRRTTATRSRSSAATATPPSSGPAAPTAPSARSASASTSAAAGPPTAPSCSCGRATAPAPRSGRTTPGTRR